MTPAMRVSVAFILATAMVEADQCSSRDECPIDDEPTNIVSLLQTNVVRGFGDRGAPAAVLSQRSDGDVVVPSSPRVAFLVRTCAPTAEMTKRITQWVSNLQVSSKVDAFVSIDQTHTHTNNVSHLLNTLDSVGFDPSHIHRYSVDDMVKAYPALEYKGDMLVPCRGHYCVSRTEFGHRYVTAAVDLFLQTLSHTHRTYDYVWLLADDVGYTGDISHLLGKYSGSADDLISSSDTLGLRTFSWETDLYKKWALPTQRVMAADHVIRLSSRLLGRLNHWLKAGAISMGECMPATVCQIEQMKCSPLNATDRGPVFRIFAHTISQADWEAFQRNDTELGMPRLYHSLKM